MWTAGGPPRRPSIFPTVACTTECHAYSRAARPIRKRPAPFSGSVAGEHGSEKSGVMAAAIRGKVLPVKTSAASGTNGSIWDRGTANGWHWPDLCEEYARCRSLICYDPSCERRSFMIKRYFLCCCTYILKVNWIWDVPKSPWKALPLKMALNDWQFSGIASFINGAQPAHHAIRAAILFLERPRYRRVRPPALRRCE